MAALTAAFLPGWDHLTGAGGGHGWYAPGDLWGTAVAASRYLHGHFGTVYSPQTGLVTLPGVLVVLAPAVALLGLLHLPLTPVGASGVVPGGWPLLEAVSLLAAVPVLFAADALAARWGVSRRRRFLLAGAEAVGAWNVVVWWGHPEDALAVALVLFALPLVFEGRWSGAAWLLGAAVVVQPLTVVCLGLLLARLPRRRVGPVVLRLLAPSAVLLAPVLAGSWRSLIHSVSQQPNFPTVDHPTPWSGLGLATPRIGHAVVAAGPLRLVAVIVAIEGGLWLGRRHRFTPEQLLWGVAVCLALRLAFEPVMVAYYAWPALAVALAGASRHADRRVLAGCAALVSFATVFGTGAWTPNAGWWTIQMASTATVLLLARPRPAPAIGRRRRGTALAGPVLR